MQTQSSTKTIIRLSAFAAFLYILPSCYDQNTLTNGPERQGTIKSVNPDTDPQWLKPSSIQRK